MKKIAVHTPNRYLATAVCKAMDEKFKGWMNTDMDCAFMSGTDEGCIYVEQDGFGWDRKVHASKYCKIISVEEFFKHYYNKINKSLKIAGHKIEDITKEGFRAGCETVEWSEIDELIKLRP